MKSNFAIGQRQFQSTSEINNIFIFKFSRTVECNSIIGQVQLQHSWKIADIYTFYFSEAGESDFEKIQVHTGEKFTKKNYMRMFYVSEII